MVSNSISYGTLSESDDEHSNSSGHHYYHHLQKNSKLVNLGWIFILTNIVLEILVLIFDQLASPKEPEKALIVCKLSLAIMIVCIAELVYRGLVKEKLTLMQCLKSLIPCSSEKKPYSFMDGLVLLAAKVQMVLASIEYGYLRKGKEPPIKVSLVSFIFIVCFVIYKLIKKNQGEANLLPVRQDN
eukprot:XP_015570747.1 uncharacterized protein LOC8270894 [Ricinus communis]